MRSGEWGVRPNRAAMRWMHMHPLHSTAPPPGNWVHFLRFWHKQLLVALRTAQTTELLNAYPALLKIVESREHRDSPEFQTAWATCFSPAALGTIAEVVMCTTPFSDSTLHIFASSHSFPTPGLHFLPGFTAGPSSCQGCSLWQGVPHSRMPMWDTCPTQVGGVI